MPVFMSLSIFDSYVTKHIRFQVNNFICSTDRTCISLEKHAVLIQFDTNYPLQNGQTPTQVPPAFYYRIDFIP